MAANNTNPTQFPDFREYFRKNKNRIAREVGNEAVRYFKENFRLEGFQNGGLKKWKDVKRRDPSSPWYGFEYKGERARKASEKKGKRKKQRVRLNFSRAATNRKILTGPTGELQRSLKYRVNPAGGSDVSVSITSDKPYAVVHNEGGTIRVFGKHSVRLPARPFVGYSKELDNKIDEIVWRNLTS